MDINLLTRDADDLIRKIVSRYNQLYIPAGNISQVELDLMLDDLRKLYDTFKTIGQVNLMLQHELKKPEVTVIAQSPVENKPKAEAPAQNTATPSEKPETEVTESVQQPESEPEHLPAYEPEPEIIHEIIAETDLHVVTDPESEKTSVYDRPSPAGTQIPVIEHVTESPEAKITADVNHQQPQSMLADKFNHGTKSLSETIAATPPQSVVGARLQFQPIADLATGIGLNDKFSFISELFANNQVQYEEAIARINKAVNLDEATWILQKYHTQDWSQNEETLNRMKDFVKRRFI